MANLGGHTRRLEGGRAARDRVALLPQRVYAATGALESVSLIASIFAMAYLLTQLPAGVLSDRFGTKPILIVGYGLCGIAGLLFFFAQSASPIYAGRVIQGVGEAPIWALGPALLSLAYPNAKGRAIGIYNAAIHAGLTLGPLLGLFVAPSGQSGVPFLLFAALCFIGGGIVLVFLPRVLRSERSQVETRASGRQLGDGCGRADATVHTRAAPLSLNLKNRLELK